MKLKIIDCFKDDAGKGIIRIDPLVIEKNGFTTGDILEIYNPLNNQRTAGLLYPGKKEDQDQSIIRLDAALRRNLGAFLKDRVVIRKITVFNALQVSFAGLDCEVDLKHPDLLAEKLRNRIITKYDILSFYSNGKERRLDLIVINFTPQINAVRITEQTMTFCQREKFSD